MLPAAARRKAAAPGEGLVVVQLPTDSLRAPLTQHHTAPLKCSVVKHETHVGWENLALFVRGARIYVRVAFEPAARIHPVTWANTSRAPSMPTLTATPRQHPTQRSKFQTPGVYSLE